MSKLSEIYKPYNFSSTKCFIITLNIVTTGYYKIEQRLPEEMKTLKGVFVSPSGSTRFKQLGFVTFGINEGRIKCFQQAVIDITKISDCSVPFPLNEPVKNNSLMQGYYYDNGRSNIYPYSLKIYLHYTLE